MNLIALGSVFLILVSLILTPVEGDIHIQITGDSTVIHHCSGECDDIDNIDENITQSSIGLINFESASIGDLI